MATGPDGERRQEPTFADVMNGFGLDSGRPVRRRLFGRRRGATGPDPRDVARAAPAPAPAGPGGPLDPYADQGPAAEVATEVSDTGAAAAGRPYTWTRGRTEAGFGVALEALVSTSARGRAQVATLALEHRAVAELCEQTRSVAEVAALLSLALGVARVVLGDMAGLGVVTV